MTGEIKRLRDLLAAAGPNPPAGRQRLLESDELLDLAGDDRRAYVAELEEQMAALGAKKTQMHFLASKACGCETKVSFGLPMPRPLLPALFMAMYRT